LPVEMVTNEASVVRTTAINTKMDTEIILYVKN